MTSHALHDDAVDDAQAPLEEALGHCFRLLSRADRTVEQVRHHLERRRVRPAVIDAAVAELERQGYLDDAAYAQRFTNARRALDGWGRERIERQLLAAGVDSELVAAALGPSAAARELEAAVTLLRRRLRSPLRTDRDRARALALLLRKGYTRDLAYEAVRQVGRQGVTDCA